MGKGARRLVGGGSGGRAERTEDEFLQRREDVHTPRHFDLVDFELQPLGEGAFGRRHCVSVSDRSACLLSGRNGLKYAARARSLCRRAA